MSNCAQISGRGARRGRPQGRFEHQALITSQAARRALWGEVEALGLAGDVLLPDWKSVGLLHPSLLRLAKVATVDEQLVERTIGHLSTRDVDAARQAFRRVFAGWMR